MAENQILPFAQGQGANVLSQADYAGDSMRLQGHQPGVARSALENKALLQCSSIAAGLAQFIADGQADDVTDAKTPAEIAAMLENANTAIFRGDNVLSAVNGFERMPSGIIRQWGANTGSVKTVTFPTAFQNACYGVIVCPNFYSEQGQVLPMATVYNQTTTGFSYLYRDRNGSDIPLAIFWQAVGA